MNKDISAFLIENGIEYFAALDIAHVRITRPHILERSKIEPKSVIVYLAPYFVSEGENISAYATSLDYHIFFSEFNSALGEFLKKMFPGAGCAGYSDSSPIDERHAALISNLGVAGKNGLLINEKYGSYVFIGEIISDILPEKLGVCPPHDIQSCIGCGACLKSCPTGVLAGRSTECLSMITQTKNAHTEEHIQMMKTHNTVWGCDMCQMCCPYNIRAKKNGITTPIPFFRRDRITALNRETIEKMGDEEFSQRAFAWKGKAVPLRNISEVYEHN